MPVGVRVKGWWRVILGGEVVILVLVLRLKPPFWELD